MTVRIAVTGSHRTGKTTLVEELVRRVPGLDWMDEPYHQLESEGHAFAARPRVADFELQLERAIRSIDESPAHCLFDRCPADVLAYLIALSDDEPVDVGSWLPEVSRAMKSLDLLVFVPIERPDRVSVTAEDDPRLRRRVHDELEEIVLHDAMGFGVPVIEVTGSPEERARAVLGRIGTSAGTSGDRTA